MMGEFAADSRAAVETATGRGATATDLYLAHFLGSAGAARFLTAAAARPEAAAGLFPQAREANRGIFFSAGRAPA